MHLVLIETSGNQAYLFATNRLAENIGASELTYKVGTQFVLEAVANQGGTKLWSNNDSPQELRDKLKNAPKIDTAPIEVIIATSGKALLLVKDKSVAKAIISEVTERALRDAPGIDVCGVISQSFNWNKEYIHIKIKEIHKIFEEIRSSRPHPSARFPTLPITALCASSGLPAFRLIKKTGEAISKISNAKQTAATDWQKRIDKITKDSGYSVEKTISHLENDSGKELDWLAVVHADGNGLGQIFLNFDKYIQTSTIAKNRSYVNKLRKFSIALEDATENAYRQALRVLKENQISLDLDIVPLVLGGDDLTVICDGKYALEFTRVFLKEFEKQTASESIIAEIAQQALNAPRLSACAGVAITKPHFPFHSSYKLAEQLIKEAKTVKQQVQKDGKPYPCSAMDFQIIYDSSFTELSEARQRLFVDNGNTRLTAKPYVVSPRNSIKEFDWANQHHIDNLLFTRIEILLQKDKENRPVLPRTQVQNLREGLFLGKQEADGRLQLIFERYKKDKLEKFVEHNETKTLFRRQTGTKDWEWETRFLDAFEAAAFWENYDAKS
jgi:hypothetical protein